MDIALTTKPLQLTTMRIFLVQVCLPLFIRQHLFGVAADLYRAQIHYIFFSFAFDIASYIMQNRRHLDKYTCSGLV